jgi:surface protein
VTTTGLSASNSPLPITGWYDSDTQTVYYYTPASKIYLSPTSSYLFSNLRVLQELDINNWDTSNVTTMLRMFNYAGYTNGLKYLDLSNWNTSKVTDMN